MIGVVEAGSLLAQDYLHVGGLEVIDVAESRTLYALDVPESLSSQAAKMCRWYFPMGIVAAASRLDR